jgi:hypothetical protein
MDGYDKTGTERPGTGTVRLEPFDKTRRFDLLSLTTRP